MQMAATQQSRGERAMAGCRAAGHIVDNGGDATIQQRQPNEHWQLISRRVIALTHLIRASAQLTYKREIGLDETEWRTLLALGVLGPVELSVLADFLDVDKAQMSRAFARLAERDMVTRARLRGPVRLTDNGVNVLASLQSLATARNHLLFRTVSTEEIRLMTTALDHVLEAAQAVAQPSEGLQAARSASTPTHASGSASRNPAAALVSRLILVSRALRRVTSPFYQQLGISDLEAHALLWIAENQPLKVRDLVHYMERDKSLVSRLVHRLVDRGLLKPPPEGKRSGWLMPTPRGSEIHEKIVQETYRNDARYRAAAGDDHAALLKLLGQITESARQLLAYEQEINRCLSAGLGGARADRQA